MWLDVIGLVLFALVLAFTVPCLRRGHLRGNMTTAVTVFAGNVGVLVIAATAVTLSLHG